MVSRHMRRDLLMGPMVSRGRHGRSHDPTHGIDDRAAGAGDLGRAGVDNRCDRPRAAPGPICRARRDAPAGDDGSPRTAESAARQHRWPLAEATGAATPEGVPDWWARVDWAAEAGRDERRVSSRPQLSAPHGVRVIAETGVLNKGQHAAGVARPSRGTVGTVAHGPRGVLVA